jgi:predicted ATP-dependent protease
MTQTKPLAADQLRLCCDPAQFAFGTTEELEPLGHAIGQDRAVSALAFALAMERPGYNVFAQGPTGMGKHYVVQQFLERVAADRPVPPDWLYVNDFQNPHRPRALQVPAGQGRAFRDAVDTAMQDVWSALSNAFSGDDYGSKRRVVGELLEERQKAAIGALQEEAAESGVAILRSAGGLALAPLRDEELLDKAEFDALPQKDRAEYDLAMEAVHEKLGAALAQEPVWEREQREQLKQLDLDTADFAVGDILAELSNGWPPAVNEWVAELRADLIGHGNHFLEAREEEAKARAAGLPRVGGVGARYAVNLLVDNAQTQGAPVVYEDFPSVGNLLGGVEHLTIMGAPLTDVTLVRGGALHRALGGFLVVDVRKLLDQPYAWEQLKRALRSGVVRAASLRRLLNEDGAVTLEPHSIPLDVKVVLVGERSIYYALNEQDPDFPQLFKIAADFDEALPRNEENVALYARLVGTLARKNELRPLSGPAVGRIVEHAARLSGHREELTMHIASTSDLLREADHHAGAREAQTTEAGDVDAALTSLYNRHDRIRERSELSVSRGEILLSTSGAAVGQVNGLSVISFGPVEFGRPARITAAWRVGTGEVVDIEREVHLGGALHSKGVLILTGYLGERYGQSRPLALTASIVMEQNYGGVDGDSASVAELCALLSALAGIPIRQGVAVTGSVNQHGEVQAIGGVNTKIEGFFDLCARRGLDGTQGCVIPHANRTGLMLRPDVVEACAAGEFSVWAVRTVDEAVSVLTGHHAAAVHAGVETTLEAAAQTAKRWRA